MAYSSGEHIFFRTVVAILRALSGSQRSMNSFQMFLRQFVMEIQGDGFVMAVWCDRRPIQVVYPHGADR